MLISFILIITLSRLFKFGGNVAEAFTAKKKHRLRTIEFFPCEHTLANFTVIKQPDMEALIGR